MPRLSHLASLSYRFALSITGMLLSANAMATTIFVEAEDYNLGGEGVGYHDSDTVRNGNYNNGRGEFVDLSRLTEGGFEAGTGDNPPGLATVSYVQSGEWLEYDVTVPVAGLYTLEIRNSLRHDSQRYLHFEIDGEDITGPVLIETTGQPWRYATNTKPGIALPAGDITLRLFFDDSSLGTNWFRFTLEQATAQTVPGRIQSENFNSGGQNVGYYDKSAGNAGDSDYRSEEDADISTIPDGIAVTHNENQ